MQLHVLCNVHVGDCDVEEKTEAGCHDITDCKQSHMQPVDVLETLFVSVNLIYSKFHNFFYKTVEN